MTDRIAVDPERLRYARARMTDLADEVGDARHRLEVRLEGEGRCWGTDEAGAAFEAAYLPASRAVRSMLATVESGVHELATVLGLLTTVLETAEHDARRVVT
ncbi:MAG: hypothetical protein IRY85_06550 [Micromonosporaceae bacterium]|nr:hypothetical protein [Micromonosporaceae bacterium]